MIEAIRQGLREDGFEVSIVKLCAWFGVARRSVYYRPRKSEPKIQDSSNAAETFLLGWVAYISPNPRM